MNQDDRTHLLRSVDLARETMDNGGGRPYGAVVVLDGRVVGEGANTSLASGDPTEHAELVAIRNACLALKSQRLEGATVYASGEPCPMCLGLMYVTGVKRYVFANSVADARRLGSHTDELYADIRRAPEERRLIVSEHRPLPEATLLFDDWLKSGRS